MSGLAAAVLMLAAVLPAGAQLSAPGGLDFMNNGYSYAPSVMVEGNKQKFWYCSDGPLPGGGRGDTIWYRAFDLIAKTWDNRGQVFPTGSTPQGWGGPDSYTCDPTVIKGQFVNPNDGQAYSYAMYYSRVRKLDVPNNNQTGVAFSTDGISWVDYNAPVLVLPDYLRDNTYGIGQPSAWQGSSGTPAIWLFYTDTHGTIPGTHVYGRVSNDGVNFGIPHPVSRAGIPTSDGQMSEVDFGFDPADGNWYGAIRLDDRSTDGAEYAIGIFRSPDPINGAWTQVGVVDTNLTGFWQNHNPGLNRDIYGNLTSTQPLQVYFGAGHYSPTAGSGNFQVSFANQYLHPVTTQLKRYYNSTLGHHWVTTGVVDPGFNFEGQPPSWYLYDAARTGTVPLYGCALGSPPLSGSFSFSIHYVSLSSNCERTPGGPQQVLGVNGYLFVAQPAQPSVALYRCSTQPDGGDFFVSTDQHCEGRFNSALLGWALTQPDNG